VAALKTHTTPESYVKNRLSPALLPLLTELATKPKSLAKFIEHPSKFLSANDELRASEKRAIGSGVPGRLRVLAQTKPADIATEFVQAVLRSPTLAQQYAAVLKANSGDPGGEDKIVSWLKGQGYDTTPEAIDTVYQMTLNVNLDYYDSAYSSTYTDGSAGPEILIQKGVVTVKGSAIKKPIYSQSSLQWTTADGNAFNTQLHFRVLTNDDGKPLPAGSYIGPQFWGMYWGTGTMPSTPNIVGKTGTAPPKPNKPTDPVQPTPLSNFAEDYLT